MISVVIPTYKNKEQLIQNLKQNLTYLNDCEIIVVNDDPEESIANDLAQFKSITLIENKKNLGFGQAVNIGVSQVKNPYILLLNSDVLLENDRFKNTVSQFDSDPTLFAVAFGQKQKDSSTVGKNTISFHNGLFVHSGTKPTKGITAWAEGGSSLLRKDVFDKLHGFDPLYSPFYWEDIDLSYRAWKSGYTVMFDPEIEVIHNHESTIGKYFSKSFVQRIAFRNQFIFTWKNMSDGSLLMNHFIHLIPDLLRFILKGNVAFIIGFALALVKLPEIITNRNNQLSSFVLSDKEILKKLS